MVDDEISMSKADLARIELIAELREGNKFARRTSDLCLWIFLALLVIIFKMW